MLNQLYTSITLACLSWVWTHFEPIQSHIRRLDNLPGTFYKPLRILLTCCKCFAFWFSLIYSQDIFISAAACVMAVALEQNLTSIKL